MTQTRLTPMALAVALTLTILGLAQPAALATYAGTVEDEVSIQASQQSYDLASKKFKLKGNVVVSYQDFKIYSQTADLSTDAAGAAELASFYDRPTAKRVKPSLGEDIVTGDILRIRLKDKIFEAEGSVNSNITTVAADPFTIRADVQQFDHINKLMSARGGVHVDYQGGTATSSSAVMRIGPSGRAERVVFTGGAELNKESSHIAGEKITVMMDSGNLLAESNVKTTVDLKGQKSGGPPKVLIYSDYQQYDKASDKMLASGHVKILYGNYTATGPKATFDLTGGNLDKIFLTGRPTIIDGARKITADKITITTNPKNFDAVGNVKTTFTQSDPAAKPAAKPAAAPARPVTGASPAPAAAPGKPTDDPLNY
ncbi:MAG: LptA/OstA family protein [Candidatus Melainabacteria bacterium]